MPAYDFRCRKCGMVEERVVPMAEATNQTCRKCRKPMVKLFAVTSRICIPLTPRGWKNRKGELGLY